MMKKSKLLLQLFLMFMVVLATVCVFTEGPNYIGKTYYQSDRFEEDTSQFVYGLAEYTLNPIDEDALKELLIVTDEDIDYYRNYYGTLSEQIRDIKMQYEDQLISGDAVVDEEIVTVLEKERDAKITDIKANFEDREHVEQKILKIKEKALANYKKAREREEKEFFNQYNYFAYDLTNVDTGENFSSGNINEAHAYQQTFNEATRFVSSNNQYHIYLSDYVEGEMGMLNDTKMVEIEQNSFTGTITIPTALMAKTELGQSYEAFNFTKYAYYVLFGLGVLSYILLMTMLKPTWKNFMVWPSVRTTLNKMPVDVAIISVLFASWITFLLMDGMLGSIHAIGYWGMERYDFIQSAELIFLIALTFLLFSLAVICIAWLRTRYMEEMNKKLLWQHTFTSKLVIATQELFLNRSIGVQSLAILIIFFLAGIGLVGAGIDGGLFMLYILLVVFVLIPALYIFMRRMGYLNRIMAQTKDMADGKLTNAIKVKGKSPLAAHASNLNALREGVRSSMTEQAKSEKMKTELITNVSHDLRTPLTSIITYTDLLKNPDLTEQERMKYIGILDSKSARLKTLIEDLFEVSKMASGNVELVKQRVDLAQLLQQAVGEQKEDFATNGLDLRINISEQPIFAYVDGQKWWRALDNLIVNARKYSLEGTRVYVNLKVVDGAAEFTVKNVAKYELNEDATELVERFKRADTSRHTEGSGLGLAIAQSIVDLHGGQMTIAVDGDLFKVSVTVKAV